MYQKDGKYFITQPHRKNIKLLSLLLKVQRHKTIKTAFPNKIHSQSATQSTHAYFLVNLLIISTQTNDKTWFSFSFPH